MTADEVRALLTTAANGNVSAWAKQNNISGAYVSDVLAGRREPGEKILQALGLIRVVTFQPADATP